MPLVFFWFLYCFFAAFPFSCSPWALFGPFLGFSWRSLRGRGGGRHCGQKQQRGGGARVASEHFWKAFWIFLSNDRRYSGIPYCSELRVRSFRTRCLVSILLFVASYLHAAKNIRQAPQKCAKRAQRTPFPGEIL